MSSEVCLFLIHTTIQYTFRKIYIEHILSQYRDYKQMIISLSYRKIYKKCKNVLKMDSCEYNYLFSPIL